MPVEKASILQRQLVCLYSNPLWLLSYQNQHLQPSIKLDVVHYKNLHSSCQTKCPETCSNESQGSNESKRRRLISALSVAAKSTHEWKMSVHADPGRDTSRLIRYLLIALIRHLLWAGRRVSELFLTTGAQSRGELQRRLWEGSQNWSKPSDFHLMGVMFAYQPASMAATANKAFL